MEPSPPIPEGPARRAAISAEIAAATGLNGAAIAALLRDFYAAARQDPLLGPAFETISHRGGAEAAQWEAHIARVTDFWSSVALMTGRYNGQPMRAHLDLGLTPAHFERWLALFSATVEEHCSPAGAALLVQRARTIARSLEMGIAVAEGQLPGRQAGAARRSAGAAD